MKTRLMGAAIGCAFTLAVSISANAALIDRGGGLIYDDDLNITWLADANYAMTSGYDADGRMTWTNAMTWAANLSYGGYTDWRLPTSDTCTGYNCTGSEMGHLIYTELGGWTGQSIVPPAYHNGNYSLFTNIQGYSYWTATTYTANPSFAWSFNLLNNSQGANNKFTDSILAWAVRDGDVAAVPVPAAVWLFGSGLLGLIGVARHKAA